MDGLLMFPLMIIGPVLASFALTAISEGQIGLKNLIHRLLTFRFSIRWYLISLLIPSVLILTVLILLKSLLSTSFAPNFFPIGFLFGIPAGILEEVGWMGYAYPKMFTGHNQLSSGIKLGILWGIWHLPVIDFLGAASPHGSSLIVFFLAFCTILVAMRMIIIWIYTKTKSIPAAQFTHICSTGFLVCFGPARVTPAEEAFWYGAYALMLWILILVFYLFNNTTGNKYRNQF